MKTHLHESPRGAETDAYRAAVCFGFVALVTGGTMLALWLLAVAFGLQAWFAEYHHALGLISLLVGLFSGSACFDRWERARSDD